MDFKIFKFTFGITELWGSAYIKKMNVEDTTTTQETRTLHPTSCREHFFFFSINNRVLKCRV